MKLSEAIRLGAMLKPQAFGDYTDGIGTCAMGSAFEAIGITPNAEESAPAEWLAFLARDHACPVCRRKQSGGDLIDGVIPHLNDDHRWTRERIADWVEIIERAQETVIATGNQPALEPAVELGAPAQKS